MARPRLSEEAKRTHRLEVRFNDEEVSRVRARAKAAGKSVADYLRDRALEDNPDDPYASDGGWFVG